jgi:hypothetical protein
MSWHDFILGGMTVILAYVFYSIGKEGEELEGEIFEPPTGLVVNGVSKHLHQLSCQTCRKIKNHREIEPRVFECTKCKRRTNLKVS